MIIGYVPSPIDLIPDFIPVPGQLDDMILIPLGIALLLRLIPRPVMAEMRERARAEFARGSPKGRRTAAAVIRVGLAAAGFAAWLVISRFLPR